MRRRAWGLVAAAALLSGAPALAQPRTGPEAVPPPLPAYPRPTPGLAPPVPDRATPPPPAMGGPVAQLRIGAEGAHGPARPPRGWRPPSDPDLRLDHQFGEGLDEGWVRRQFDLNGVPGAGGVGRALALVQLINRAYLSAGFVNSGLVVRPSQAPGVLELRVIYGGLAASEAAEPFRVEWAQGGDQGLNRDFVRDRMRAAARKPLNAIELERDFRLLAADPAVRTVNADLRPGSRPGEASLVVSVYPADRFDLYVTAANNRSPSVGGERAALGGSARNLVFAGDLLSGEAGITEGLENAALSYALPFLSPRNTLSVRAAYNDAAVVDRPLIPLEIEARDRSVEVGLTRRFIDTPLLPGAEAGRWIPARTLSAGLVLTRRISKTYLLNERFSFSPGSVNGRSEYTALRLIGDYVVRDVDQVFAVSVTATQGLDGTGSDAPGALSPKEDFHTLLAQVNYARRLSDAGLELRARLAGQWTDSTLYSGERFSAGGETTVRGYRENLLLADKGAIGSVEIAQPVNLFGRQDRGFDWGAFTVSAFADGATMRNKVDPQPVRWIYSVGVSAAWTPTDAIAARITYGEALNRVPPSGEKDLQDHGFQARLTIYPLRLLK